MPALAIRNHVFLGSIGSAGSGAGQLSSPASVAVDNSTGPAAGDVYVADTGNARIDQFDSDGNFIRAWGWGVADGTEVFETCTLSCQKGIPGPGPGQFETPRYIAVDGSSGPSAGDVYVADDGTGLVQKFTNSGELIAAWGNNGPGESPNGQLNGSNATPKENPYVTVEGPFRAPFFGIAVDVSGNLWVYDGQDFMFEFDQSDAFTTSWYPEVAGHPSGIAVDSSDHLYVNGDFERVEKFTSTGGRLGAVIPGPDEVGGTSPTGLTVDPVTNDLYVDAGGNLIERIASSCEPSGGICAVAEAFGPPQLTGAGLAVALGNRTVYVADRTADTVDIFVLHPPGAPTVESQAVSFVTSGSATFSAGLNPQGVSTEYHFEYGPTTSYGETVPITDAAAGSDFEVHEVSTHIQDLLAHTTYHFRVVAHNNDGTIYGEDQIFITQATGGGGGLVLPDGRSYELVTPPDKHGALFYGLNAGWMQNTAKPFVAEASVDGGAMVELASQPTEDEPQGNSNEVSVFSSRGPAGWSSQVLAPSHNEATSPSIGKGGEYRFFSEDLSHGVLQPFGNFTPLSPEASESTAYLRADYLGDDANAHCQMSCFQPLVTAGNTRAGAVFGEEIDGQCEHFICGPEFVDATPDLSHVILSSPVQLTAAHAREGGLYEWSAGQLQLISAPPEGEEGSFRLAGSRVMVSQST